MKRMLDVLASGAFLLVFWPVLLILVGVLMFRNRLGGR